MKLITLIALSSSLALASFSASVSKITPEIKNRMINGGSYRVGCPAPLSSLRYLRLKYIGFDEKEHTGELIVNKSVTKDIVGIFKGLYNAKYPIRKMHLVSNYGGSDFASIEADNTSAFNCRPVDGTNKWSKHSYGRAIDINPIENPFVTRSGHTSHRASRKYLRRARVSNSAAYRALILKRDYIVNIFKKYGWRWGGYFNSYKDYQHFDKR